jgi:anti-sigma regulatory factor (Ser/Thr protein kinase)
VISSEERVNELVAEACEPFEAEYTTVFLTTDDEIVEHLNYELPEISVLNCSDPALDVRSVVNTLRSDPWLHYGGFILVYDSDRVSLRSHPLGDLNVVSTMETHRIVQYFPRLLRILSVNQNILFQRDIHALLHQNLSGVFVLDNDPFDLATYTNLLANFLFNAGLITADQREDFHVALMELLVNAIEHGNCRISYQEKSEYLASGRDPMELIREKNADPEIQSRKVYLSYRIQPHASRFTIRDQGEGFDWRSYRAPSGESGALTPHGRGIAMAEHYLQNLEYNETGNEVSFEVPHLRKESHVVPEAFSGQRELEFAEGDTVFSLGEQSSNLYYIVSGAFNVVVNEAVVSQLTTKDMFVGEMSFLLNNRRSATVVCAEAGSLIQISKEEFVDAIKTHPHYGLFLARLLARRLQQLHAVYG